MNRHWVAVIVAVTLLIAVAAPAAGGLYAAFHGEGLDATAASLAGVIIGGLIAAVTAYIAPRNGDNDDED